MDMLVAEPVRGAVPAAASADVAAFEALPFVDPRRKLLTHYDFPKAWRHFRELVNDKENTAEVFPIFEALPWRGFPEAARRFLSSDEGRRIRAAEPYLPPMLDDHEALRRMPKGSLAHAYCDFMEREGLSAQGLVDEYARFADGRPQYVDQIEWYYNRSRDTHDLLHVLTGYGRDALGEQCVLAFTYGQQPSPAHLFLGYAGGYEIKRRMKLRAPILRAVREGQKLGRACPRLIEQPIFELLPLPIEDVRKRLNIVPARRYAEVHAAWRAHGIDPYDLLSAKDVGLAA